MSKRNVLKWLGFALCMFIAQLGYLETTVAEDELFSLKIRKGPYLQNVQKDRITIMWETNMNASSCVSYGKTISYDKKVICKKLKAIHEIDITGLEEETIYHYQVSSKVPSEPAEEVLRIVSKDNVFKTAVRKNTPFCFAVYGDSRSNVEYHTRIAEAIAKKRPDIVLHVGDVVENGNDYGNWGNYFFEPGKVLIKCQDIDDPFLMV